MLVLKIKLFNFRNYQQLNLKLSSGVNIFYGKNGQGKTNVMEALYLTLKGQSFRPAKTEMFLTKSLGLSSLQGVVSLELEKKDVKNILQLKISNHKKNYLLNNKRVSTAFLNEGFPIVLFSPESLAAIKEGPDQRRMLIDEWLVLREPKSTQLLNDFTKALRMRNKVLKDYKTESKPKKQCLEVLASINEIYFPLAARLTVKRIQALQLIVPSVSQAMNSMFPKENLDISVDYLISSISALGKDYSLILSGLIDRADQLHNSELDSGISLVGPHKHDIQFLVASEDSRYYCSQGQQRALILSFKMAQITEYHRVFGDYPLLLLDDVLSELDLDRRTYLIDFLSKIDSQIFITTTDLSFGFEESYFATRKNQIAVFQIENGVVTPELSD